tara:strand:+ start:579 stop:1346 length:768 start_codon:yes stop_codon:yes gene_type:complete
MKASVVIANYNNGQFINECINSLNSQTYDNIEIIFFDDNSQDNSIEIIKKFKNVKVIKNNVQTNFGSINQINAFKKGIELSTGDVIFFLDSDDYFHKSKIEKIVNQFLEDSEKMVVFDFPIIVKNKKEIIKKKRDSLLKTYWGYIHPTSCISIRKEIVNKIFDSTLNDNFKNIWLDLRILLFSKNLLNYKIVNDNLTYYRQTEDNVSSKFKKYSKNWWKRRNEAHDYYFYFMKKNNLKTKKNLDFYFTKILNKFI